jgi:hypothetical protein
VLRAAGTPGDVKLLIESDDLSPAVVDIAVR